MDDYKRLLKKTFKDDRKSFEWLLSKDFSFSKMPEQSEKFRKSGNDLYSQDNHTPQQHRSIFKYYCKSIAFAPPKSQQLALAFGNRSAFLLHIRKYEEAIRDIDRAIDITESSSFKAKLLCRKIECLKKLGSSEFLQDIDEDIGKCIDEVTEDESKSRLIKKYKQVQALRVAEKTTLDSERHKKMSLPTIDNILERIEIRQNEKYGRYTVAARDYKPGEIIYIEDLYATAIEQERTHISCHYCLKTAWSGVPCEECNWAMFCSEVCKQKAWNEFHDIECSVIPYLCLNTETITSDISLRLVILGWKECGSVEKLRDQLRSVDACTDSVRKGFYVDGKLSSQTIRSIYSLKDDGLTSEHVKNIVQAIPSIVIGLVKCPHLPKKYKVKKLKDLWNNDELMFLGSLLIKFAIIHTLDGFTYDNSYKCEVSTDFDNCIDVSCCRRAVCVAPFASLINQSCFPNASRYFTDDRQIAIYAVHPIKKNSQIFITYFSAFYYDPFKVRQEILYDNYGFVCDCKPCSELWPTVLDEEYNYLSSTTEERIFKPCEKIIEQIHDNTQTIQYDEGKVETLSKAITEALESLQQPSHLTCLLIKSLSLYHSRNASLQPESFGSCDKFSK